MIPPHDEFYGSDLGKDEEFVAMAEQTGDLPTWKHFAPPCRTYTKARRVDTHGKVKRLRSDEKPEGFGCQDTKEANTLVDRTAHLCEKQHQDGKFFSVENPWESYLWVQKSMKRLATQSGTRLIRVDQCAYGGPYHKPTGVLTNAPWLDKGLVCGEAPPHQHTVLEGRVWSYKVNKEVWLTSEAAEYPTGMCEDWATRWLKWLKENPDRPGKPSHQQGGLIKVGKFRNKLVREELEPAVTTK